MIMWMVRSHRVNILCIYYLFILFIHSVIPFICCSTALMRVRAMSTKGELNLSMKQNILTCSTFLMLPLKNPLLYEILMAFVWLVGLFLAIYTLTQTCVAAKMGETRQAWR